MNFEDTLGDMGELLNGSSVSNEKRNESEGESGNAVYEIEIALILDNPAQPRKTIAKESIDELAKTIKKYGVLQPIVVKKSPKKEGYYELIAGQRRILASKKSGLKTIPAIQKNVSSQDAAALAIIENIQKENLPAMEEAQSFGLLISQYDLTQKELASTIGKDEKYVGRMLALLSLPEIIKTAFNAETIKSPQAAIELKKAFEKDEQATAEFIADNQDITYKQANEFYKAVRDGQTLNKANNVSDNSESNTAEHESSRSPKNADDDADADADADADDETPTKEIVFDYKEDQNPSEVSGSQSEPDSRDPNKIHMIDSIASIIAGFEDSSLREVAEAIILRLREDDVNNLIETLDNLADANFNDLSETIVSRFS